MFRQSERIGPTQAHESVRNISGTSSLLNEVKAQIVRAWRLGRDTRAIAREYRISRIECEAVLHEHHIRKVVEISGPRPTGPAIVMRRAA